MHVAALVRSCIRALPLVVLAFPLPTLAQQDDRARTEALAARGRQRMEALHREADDLASQERTLLGDLRTLEVTRQIRIEELRKLDAEASQVDAQRTAITEGLRTLQEQDSATRPGLEARLVEMYKLRQARYVRLLLSTSSVRRLGQASRTAAALAKLDRDRVTAHQLTRDNLTATRGTLDERSRRLEALRAGARSAEAEVTRAAQARSAAIRDIDRQRDLNAQLAGELQVAQQKLQAALRTLAAGSPVAEPASLPLNDVPRRSRVAGDRRRPTPLCQSGGQPDASVKRDRVRRHGGRDRDGRA